MGWLIGYGVGGLVFGFMVVVLSAALEEPEDSKQTMRQLLWWMAFWPLMAVLLAAAFIGYSIRDAKP